MLLDMQHLQKSFGPKSVLRDVNFQARSGSALGLLGRNGAGKTTTIRIIMQVFQPDRGAVLLDGKPILATECPIGYLPEEKGLYPKIKIREQLVYFGQLRGLSRSDAAKSVNSWLQRLELTEYLDKKLETLSKGNQQKIQLAVALLADPTVIILDEPFGGLDPVNAQLLKDIVGEQVAMGKIVLFSSHQMSYVEQFCDHVAILHQGEIVLNGSIREIKRSYERNRLMLGFAGDPAVADALLRQLLDRQPEIRPLIASWQPSADGCLVRLRQAADRPALFQALAAQNFDMEQFRVVEPSLEEIFVEKVGDTLENEAVPNHHDL